MRAARRNLLRRAAAHRFRRESRQTAHSEVLQERAADRTSGQCADHSDAHARQGGHAGDQRHPHDDRDDDIRGHDANADPTDWVDCGERHNPAVDDRRGSRQNVVMTDGETRPSHRVLIAEDEALIRLDLAEMLREEGYEIVGEAGDGQEAVELAEQLNPDLVIMDVKMPRRDGIDAASEIARKRIAPIVVLTAFSQRDLVERARDAGAMAYLVKPFTISDLIPAIELALSRFSEVRALEREVETLSDQLETRKLVERAKGLLQANQGMTEPEAFKWIQRAAMDRRTTMKHVAEVVLETLQAPSE